MVIPKPLAMARLLVVASLFAILPSSTTRFCRLAPLLLQQVAPYCLLLLPDCVSTTRLTPVVVSQDLRAWCPRPWIDVITSATVRLWLQCRPTTAVVCSRNVDHSSAPSGPIGPWRANPFFGFQASLPKVLGLSPVRLYELLRYMFEVLLS